MIYRTANIFHLAQLYQNPLAGVSVLLPSLLCECPKLVGNFCFYSYVFTILEPLLIFSRHLDFPRHQAVSCWKSTEADSHKSYFHAPFRIDAHTLQNLQSAALSEIWRGLPG